MAHVLGFDAPLIAKHYQKEAELEEKRAAAGTIEGEVGGSSRDMSKIEGMLLLKQRESEKKQGLLDAFDFRFPDKEKVKDLVDGLEVRIAELNGQRYSLGLTQKRIRSALEEEGVFFSPDDARRLFNEAGVVFSGQIKKDFEQLVAFNRAVTDERRGYLEEERAEVEADLRRVNKELADFGKRRSDALAFLKNEDTFAKYKAIANEVVVLRADIIALERQRELLHRLQALRVEIRAIDEERGRLQAEIERNVAKLNADQGSVFSSIRVFFSDIVEEVIDRKALLSVSTNQQGHLEFRSEILDESGNATSASSGHTYKKLLCIAFDLAVLRAHLDESFPRFAYHDGAFESLDDRKKENLLVVMRQYAQLGVQVIITAIDSDMPRRERDDPPVFHDDEVVLLLHDEGDQGRLFKMPAW